MDLHLNPRQVAMLAGHVRRVGEAAETLALFGEMDPDLAGECGVEICALEARSILRSGAPGRLAAAAAEAARTGRPLAASASDLDAVSRLEAVLSLGNSRIGLRLAALDAEASQEPMARIGGLLGLATGAVGLIKSVF